MKINNNAIDNSFSKYLQDLKDIVQHAGDIAIHYFTQQACNKTYKLDGSIVTDADIAIEKYIIQQLNKLIPEAGIYAEESGISGDITKLYWVIDPLDGTTNFSNGLPYFCIAIALIYNQQPIMSVIYQPLLKELFHAVKNYGSYLNNQKITISNKHNFADIVIGVTRAYYYDQTHETLIDLLINKEIKCRTIRNFGAAILDQAYCARGSLDLIIQGQLSWWDAAAGSLLISEAGGVAIQRSGKEINQSFDSFFGGNKILCNLAIQYDQNCYKKINNLI